MTAVALIDGHAEPPLRAPLQQGVDEDRNAHDRHHPHGHRVAEAGVVEDVAGDLDADQDRGQAKVATGEGIGGGVGAKGVAKEEDDRAEDRRHQHR